MTTSATTIRPLVAGNWKMNGVKEAIGVAETVAGKLAGINADVMICPPATLIGWMSDRLGGTAVSVGGQDCHTAVSGAHTAIFPLKCWPTPAPLPLSSAIPNAAPTTEKSARLS